MLNQGPSTTAPTGGKLRTTDRCCGVSLEHQGERRAWPHSALFPSFRPSVHPSAHLSIPPSLPSSFLPSHRSFPPSHLSLPPSLSRFLLSVNIHKPSPSSSLVFPSPRDPVFLQRAFEPDGLKTEKQLGNQIRFLAPFCAIRSF